MPGHGVEADGAGVGGVVEGVDVEASDGGRVGGGAAEIGLLAVLDEDVTDDLHLVVVGVGRMLDLADDARVGGIGAVEDGERQRAQPDMGDVDELAALDDLHGVADAIKVAVADEAHVPGVRRGLHAAHVGARLHAVPPFEPGGRRRARPAVAHYITQRVGRWTTEARCWEQGRSIEEMRGERRVIAGTAAACADVLASLQVGWRLPYVATHVALTGLTPIAVRRSMERLAAQVVPQGMKPAATTRRRFPKLQGVPGDIYPGSRPGRLRRRPRCTAVAVAAGLAAARARGTPSIPPQPCRIM